MLFGRSNKFPFSLHHGTGRAQFFAIEFTDLVRTIFKIKIPQSLHDQIVQSIQRKMDDMVPIAQTEVDN